MREPALPSLSIEPIRPGWRQAALRLLFQYLPATEQDHEIECWLNQMDALAETGLLGVIHDAEVIGVVATQMQAGRTAIIRPPQVRYHGDELGRRLAVAAVQQARRQGATMGQAQLALDEHREKSWLEVAGLRHIADMECLAWPASAVGGQPASPLSSSGLTWEQYAHPAQRSLLEQVLAQTWIHTLDCPALDGLRDPADALESFLAASDGSAVNWFGLREGRQYVGCLLLADQAADDEMELVYMGLAPAWRCRGLGHVLVRHAQQMVRRRGRKVLTTAVDAANAPACAVYAAAGFVAYDRRQVMWMRFV